MLDEKIFREKLSAQIDRKNEIISKLFGEKPVDKQEMIETYTEYARRLKPYIRDTGVMVYESLKRGEKVLFEGAQGSLLDIDLGTYPYVTSSHPTSGGFTTGSGIGAGSFNEVLGITKAYTTRVGKGPFVTEEDNETGDKIRELGHEYGVTTGRPRRCGWFDAVVVKYSARINGMTGLALMLLDVLGDFETIKLCHQYDFDGEKIDNFPARLEIVEECKPVYRSCQAGCAIFRDADPTKSCRKRPRIISKPSRKPPAYRLRSYPWDRDGIKPLFVRIYSKYKKITKRLK
jgi:adenylosuccinate synthase